MFYTTYSDDEHDGVMETHTSLFEATCSYYYMLPDLEEKEVGELGELLNYGTDEEEMEGLVFSA
tara:strand:- start:1245 stop:1436 length:192 start_codon:yes stop_codon:yes gene_type:complete